MQDKYDKNPRGFEARFGSPMISNPIVNVNTLAKGPNWQHNRTFADKFGICVISVIYFPGVLGVKEGIGQGQGKSRKQKINRNI